MSLYTKTGDKGKSSISNGKKMDKSSLIFEVLGEIDNLNSVLGFLQNSKNTEIRNIIISIQQDLLLIGSLISKAIKGINQKEYWVKRVQYFERTIDSISKSLPKLDSFILPGGSQEASSLHIARVECRKVERELVRYSKSSGRKDLSDICLYLNRLSDFLFILARLANKRNKVKELVWKGSK